MRPLIGFVRRVMAFGPPAFRRRYETEIVDTLSSALEAERRRGGILAMSHLGLRSVVDAICTVRRERALAAWPGGKGGAMTDWLSDVRFVLRGWRRAPGFSVTIVLTLVLGLGLASAIFAFADGYLFRPLPFPGADRTYFVSEPKAPIAGMLRYTDTLALRRSTIAEFGFVEWSAGHRVTGSEMTIDGRSVEFFAYDVSPAFRQTLPIPLIAGRDFSDQDHRDGDPVPAWISHRFWMREFGGDRGVIGRTYPISGRLPQRIVIVGILGPAVASFDLNNRPPDAVVPEVPAAIIRPTTLSYPLVRLPESMPVEQGTALISSVLRQIAPSSDGQPREVRLRSLTEIQLRGGQPTARVLFAGAMLVLLLATINLVHLLLTRGVARAAELATRAALGAGRWRLTRLFLTDSLMFGAVGIGGGLLLGRALASLIEARIPMWPTGSRNMALVPMLFDWRVVMFATMLGLTVALVGGLWPAWRALRRSLSWNSRSAAGVVAAIPARLSRSILASELAVATIVMVGTLFIGMGIWRYLHQPLGFDYDDRFWVGVTKADRQPLLPTEIDAIVGAVRTLPSVRAAGTSRLAIVRGVEVPGRTVDPKTLSAYGVTPGFRETWGLRLRDGRWFEPQEFAGAEPVAVVDQKLARIAWPDGDALGQPINVGGVLCRVVGIIEPRRESLSRETPGTAYVPAPQPHRFSSAVVWAPGGSPAELNTRAAAAVETVVPGARTVVERATLSDFFLREIGEAQFQAPVVAAFGVLAFALAGIGVFGLVSYLVEQRMREYGIRLALGARPRDIWRSVIRQSVNPALAGLAAGIAGAWALESVVRSTVFGWSSSGVGAAVVVAVALIAVAIAAAMVPARRAMRIDPAVTLRME